MLYEMIQCSCKMSGSPPLEIPGWLGDVNVRNGIHALLKCERCLEEQHHLGLEADNMCQWFGYKLMAVQVALLQSESLSP